MKAQQTQADTSTTHMTRGATKAEVGSAQPKSASMKFLEGSLKGPKEVPGTGLTSLQKALAETLAEKSKPVPSTHGLAEAGAGQANLGRPKRAQHKPAEESDDDAADDADTDDEECEICGETGMLLLCDGCDLGFHHFCVSVTLEEVDGLESWFCSGCKDVAPRSRADDEEGEHKPKKPKLNAPAQGPAPMQTEKTPWAFVPLLTQGQPPEKKVCTCGLCGQVGHNKRKCPVFQYEAPVSAGAMFGKGSFGHLTSSSTEPLHSAMRTPTQYSISIGNGPLGLVFGAREDGTQEVLKVGMQCKEAKVKVGDTVVSVARQAIQWMQTADIVAIIQRAARPFEVVFDCPTAEQMAQRAAKEKEEKEEKEAAEQLNSAKAVQVFEAVYKGNSGASWTTKHWMTDAPLDQWEGVSIDPAKNITELKFPMQCLEILRIPDTISNLDVLVALDLCCCSSLHALPNSIGSLKALKTLGLGGCRSLLELPSSIGKLKNLVRLDCHGCVRLKQLPASIGELAALVELDCCCCISLQGLPTTIGSLKTLANIDMHGCVSLHDLPGSLVGLSSLAELNLCCCSALQALPSMQGLTQLTQLDLSGCTSLQDLATIKTTMEARDGCFLTFAFKCSGHCKAYLEDSAA